MEKNTQNFIFVKNARENNLQSVTAYIPKNKLVVISGVSGSGKSTFALDTLYAEGQRRYMDSLSFYSRQFLNIKDKPDVEMIEGLSPAIAIDQKTTSRNPRSTVGTITDIYDYLRLLFARVGDIFCPKTNEKIRKINQYDIIDFVNSFPFETKIRICANVIKNKQGPLTDILNKIYQEGYTRIKINDKLCELESLDFKNALKPDKEYKIDVIVDRVIVNERSKERVTNSVLKALNLSEGSILIDLVEVPTTITSLDGVDYKQGDTIHLSTRISHDFSLQISEVEPNIFSFNNPKGACEACSGIGSEKYFSEELMIANPDASLLDGAIGLWKNQNIRYYSDLVYALAKKYNFNPNTPYKDLTNEVKNIIFYGTEEQLEFEIKQGSRVEKSLHIFKGIMNEAIDSLDSGNTNSDYYADMYEEYQTLIPCRTCNGYRLKKESLCIKIDDYNIGEISSMSIDKLLEWICSLHAKLNEEQLEISNLILREIEKRTKFLIDVGLKYLNLLRCSTSLSGGEAQRIRLASQIGSGLSGVLYVLDEPSIGLHQSDNMKLIQSIKNLISAGNSVIVIEHDEDTIREADYIIDFGPGAGKYGGNIISQGSLEEILQDDNSVTGRYLSGKDKIEVPAARRQYGKSTFIEITKVRENNLKNVDLKIPLGKFVAICGISGSGKSSLILDTLYHALNQKLNNSKIKPGIFDEIKGWENIDKIIKIDQKPIGATPRSCPATYTGIFNVIRDLFVALPIARARGYSAGSFSFNTKGGRCENCKGDGKIKVEMYFLPDVFITCNVCHGKRYNKDILEIKYKNASISDFLQMTVREAYSLLKDIPHIKERLDTLIKVGLDYIKLGQPANTLSGGEAQRIKLSKELSKRATGDTMYIIDEPTTGLHFKDIEKLIDVLQTIVDYGNTVLVIEHNLDVIKTADYLVDMGPEGGENGGYILAQGTPEEVVMNEKSVTGPFLKPLLIENLKRYGFIK